MKTKQPISLRFDEDDLRLAKTKSGITRTQKLIDFLLTQYVLELKTIPPTFKGQTLPMEYVNLNNVGILQSDGSTETLFPKHRLKRPFTTLQALINECESQEEYEPLRKEIEESDHLTSREKAILLRKK